ncbi:MAG: dual specificity protein phosphatase family protein [Gemmataceae bacterium]
MAPPHGFSWIEKPHLAAMARPSDIDDLLWLRNQGIQLLVSLTEDRLRRDWVNESGLLVFHVPMIDMEAPTLDQLDRAVSAINRAIEQQMGVAVHCGAGLGRTGVVLAAYLVKKGLSPQNAISRVRRLRPGSIETDEQAEVIEEYARHL